MRSLVAGLRLYAADVLAGAFHARLSTGYSITARPEKLP